MAEFIKLPVEIENFEKIRRDGFYYVDKTGLIEQLLNNWGEVNLFTRPRRFGKTLNMSMFKCFFEIGTDHSLFEGLYISTHDNPVHFRFFHHNPFQQAACIFVTVCIYPF